MAIIRSALAPRIRKRVGDTIFKRRLGQTIASQRALTVKNPRTPKQIAQRAKFALVIGMCLMARFTLTFLFPITTYRGTKLNKLTKYFLKKIVETAYPITTLTGFNGTALGNGSAFPIVPLTVTAITGRGIRISWDPLAVPAGALNTGIMSCFAWATNRRIVGFDAGASAMSIGSSNFFTTSPFHVGDTVVAMLGQKYTDATGKVTYSVQTCQTVVAAVTIIT